MSCSESVSKVTSTMGGGRVAATGIPTPTPTAGGRVGGPVVITDGTTEVGAVVITEVETVVTTGVVETATVDETVVTNVTAVVTKTAGVTTGDGAVIKITGGTVVTGYTKGSLVDTGTTKGAVTAIADVTTRDAVTATDDDTGSDIRCAEVTTTDAE